MGVKVNNITDMLDELINYFCSLEDELNAIDLTTEIGQDRVVYLYNLNLMPSKWESKSIDTNRRANRDNKTRK